MASMNDFLNPNSKAVSILELTEQKKKNLAVRAENLVATAGTGAGIPSSTGEELALRTDPFAYLGISPEAQVELGVASLNARKTLAASRDAAPLIGDSANSLVSGILGGLGGIVALGTSVVNKEAGAKLANKVNQGTTWAQSLQSEELQNRRAFFDERAAMRRRDNDAIMEQEIADGVNPVDASIRSFMRGAADGVTNLTEDTALAGDALANTAGSFVTGGILGGALKKAGAATLGKVVAGMQREAAATGTIAGVARARMLDTLADSATKAAYPLGIGLQEGGGAFTSTVADALQHGASMEEAGQAGIDVAKIVVPLATAAGMVSRAGEHPFTLGSTAKTAAKEILFDEPVEEGLQSAVSTAAQNAVIADSGIDPDRRMVSGVGESTSQGMILGAASTGAVKAPYVPVAAVQGVAAGVAKVAEIGQTKIDAATAKASNAAIGAVAKQNSETVPAATVQATEAIAVSSLSDEQKAQITANLKQIADFTSSTEIKESAPVLANPAIATVVADSTSNTDTLHRLVAFAAHKDTKPADAYHALNVYFDEVNNVQEQTNSVLSSQEVLNTVGQDHPSVLAIANFLNTFGALESTPEFKKMAQRVAQQAKATKGGATLGNATNPDVVSAVTAMAQVAPDSVDRNQVETILKHSSDGLVSLSNSQMAALKHAKTLLDAAATVDPDSAVAKNVLTDVAPPENMPHALSAFAHVKAIKDALVMGDFVTAQHSARTLRDFTRSQMNKVTALNKSLVSGKPEPFMTLKSDGTFGISTEVNKGNNTKNMIVHKGDERSYKFARSIHSEAATLAALYNAVATNFPELGVKAHETVVALDPVILGSQAETANAAYTPDAAAISAMTDEALNARIEALQERRMNKSATADELAEFKALDAEMSARETKAAEENAQQEKNEKTQDDDLEALVPVAKKATKRAAPAEAVDSTNTEEKENGLKVLYPQLTFPNVNPFFTAFRPAKVDRKGEKEATTTNVVAGNEINNFIKDTIFKVLNTSTQWGDVANAKLAFTRIMDDTQGTAAYLWGHVNDLIQRDLKSVTVGGKAPIGERLLNAQDDASASYVMTSPLARITSLLVPGDKHALVLDTKLGKLGIAAALGYVAEKMFSSVPVLDLDEYLKGFGLEDADISAAELTHLLSGHDYQATVNAITSNIVRFWGLTPSNTAPTGDTYGIPATLAVMVVDGLIKMGHIQSTTMNIDGRDMVRLSLNKEAFFGKDWVEDGIIFGDSINKAVLNEYEREFFVNGEEPPIAQTRMNNRNLENTKDDKEAIAAHSKSEFTFNIAMVNHYLSLGMDGVVALFGEPITKDDSAYNTEHLAALRGKVNTLQGAYKVFEKMGNIAAQMEAAGGSFAATAFRYAFNMSSVGRMQMLGGYNPQNSKLLREVLVATWGIIDATSDKGKTFINLAIGQALGKKIHKQSWDETNKQVAELLEKDFKPVLDLLRAAANSRKDFFETVSGSADVLNAPALRQAFAEAGVSNPTPVMLHALSEWVRLEMADETGKKAFKTSLYVEADGVTNGPTMAQLLLTAGKFTAQWVKNIGKGGIVLGNKTTLSNYMATDSVDLYEAVINRVKETYPGYIKEVLNKSHKNSRRYVAASMDNTLKLLATFVPGVKIAPDRKDIFEMHADTDFNIMNFTRDVAKNPLTVTTYGSGTKGIANKLTNAFADSLYALATKAAEAKQSYKGEGKPSSAVVASWWFPNDKDALKKYAALLNMLNDAVKSQLVVTDFKAYTQAAGQIDLFNLANPETLKLTSAQFDAISSNILATFVRPMAQGIWHNLGKAVQTGVETVRDVTSLMGQAQTHLFQKIINEYLEENKIQKSDFLSRKQMEEIYAILREKVPAIETGHQTFAVGKRQAAPLKNRGHAIVKTSDGRDVITEPTLMAPADPGVQGIPMINIGMGDGRMMQWLAQRFAQDNDYRFLLIFDGAHVPLDRLQEMGGMANEAVAEAATDNPFIYLQKAYETFLKNGAPEFMEMIEQTLKDFDEKEPQYPQLRRFFIEHTKMWYKPEIKGLGSVELVVKELAIPDYLSNFEILKEKLAENVKETQANKETLSRVNMSYDQMAGAEMPAYREGGINLQDHSPEAKEEILNELASKVREEQDQAREDAAKDAAIKAAESKITKLNPTQVMARLGEMTGLQKEVLKHFFNKFIRNSGYTFVFGSAADITNYRNELGLFNVEIGKNDKGFIDRSNKIIAVIGEPTTETILHEMIHAALGNALEAFYAKQAVPAEVKLAIEELEKLMADFIESQGALDSLPGFPMSVLTSTDKAANLHEFVAWSLSNPALLLKQKQQSRKMIKEVLLQLTKKVWARLKSAFGITDLENVHDQMKLFAGTVANYNKTLTGMENTTALKHSPQVAELRRAIDEKFLSMFDENNLSSKDISKMEVEGHAAAILQTVEQAFNLSPQDLITLGSIVKIFATEAKINTAAFNQINHLYQQVLDKLDQDSFIPENTIDRDAARPTSKAKYDILNGRSLTRKDPYGRSSIVPVFMALAMIDPQLREILKNLPIPKNDKNATTFDDRASELGNSLMNTLSARLGGQTHVANMQQAFDELALVLNDSLQKESSLIDGISTQYSNIANTGNDWAVGLLEKISNKGSTVAEWLESNNSPSIQLAGKFVSGLSAMISEEKAGKFATDTIHSLNQLPEVWKPFYDMMNGIIGRTAENAPIMDMIKTVRSTVQQVRQMYRDDVPKVIRKQFKQTLSDEQWGILHANVAKLDMAVFMENWSSKRVFQLMTDKTFRKQTLDDLLAKIPEANTVAKAQQLAKYLVTGEAGAFLIPNAAAIVQFTTGKQDAALVEAVDQYVTVLAYEQTSQASQDAIASLVQDEEAGMDFVLGYLHAMRTNEKKKVAGFAELNRFKGYVPIVNSSGTHLFVGNDADRYEYEKLGYTRVGDYAASMWDNNRESRGYYYTNETFRSPVSQGIMQMAKNTVNGVDTVYGMQMDGTAGIIAGKRHVAQLTERLTRNPQLSDNGTGLRPLFDAEGKIVAFERMLDPSKKALRNPSTKLDELMGVWAGRQIEEQMATASNQILLQRLRAMYDAQAKEHSKEFVDLFGGKLTKVQQDMVDLIPKHLMQDILLANPDKKFWVRKDMLEDVLGYRNASIGDVFTGSTDMNENARRQIERVLVGTFGMEIGKKLLTGERVLQNTMGAVKHNIVVRSVVVPAMNIVSNIYQLRSIGVPFHTVIRGMPHKLAEIHQYTKSYMEQVDLQTQLEAIKSDPTKSAAIAKLEARIQAIVDGHKRMAIWPLIEAGEFSTVSDVGMTAEDLTLTSGKFDEYIESKLNKLPPGMKTLAQYGWVARDTALYKALQKSVQYGDFVAKAILYDHLTQAEGKTTEEAIGQISEEFVNYDRLPSRQRGYLESIGMVWFFNYKLRIIKSAARALRNKPLHVLLAGLTPAPVGVGLPISDNFFVKLMSGSIFNSIGPGMAIRGAMLNPWINITN